MSRRSTLAPMVLLLGTLAVSVLAVEIVLRVYANVADTSLAGALNLDPYTILVEPHGEAGYRPRPERVIGYDNGSVANINALGFRGPAVSLPKPDGVLRVVLLGGSTTFGWGVGDDETIDAHMRAIMADQYPERVVEVVNLGFDGYDSFQLLERFRSDGLRLDPDIVIVNSGVNDVRNAWYSDIVDGDARTLLYQATLEQLRFEAQRGGPTVWTRTKHYLYLARVPGWVRSQMLKNSVGTDAVAERPELFHWDALDYFERNLARIQEAASAIDASVLYSTPPSSLLTKYAPDDPPIRSYWLHDARSTQMYRDSLDARTRALVERMAAEGASLSYVQHEPLNPALFLDDAHLTGGGNRRVAENFVEALRPWLINGA